MKISTVVSQDAAAATKGTGGDFYGRSATLNFPVGLTTTQMFTFGLIDDSSAEADELIDIRLFGEVGGIVPISLNPIIIVDDD